MSLFTPVEHSGTSLKEAVRHLEPVHEAALYIQDALVYSTHTHPRPGEAARTFHLVQLLMQPMVHWALRLLVLVAFFEMPAWCATDPPCAASLSYGRLTGAYSSGPPTSTSEETKRAVARRLARL